MGVSQGDSGASGETRPVHARPLAATHRLPVRRGTPGSEGKARGAAGPRGGACRSPMDGDVPGFLLALQARGRPEAVRSRVQEQELRQWGLTGEWLGDRPER